MIRKLILLMAVVMMSGCADTVDDTPLHEQLSKAVQQGVPGISVAIADKNGLIWTGVAGKADLTSGALVREDQLFGIGSITKTFVAVVTLQLVEEGRLGVEQTVLEILGPNVVGEVPGANRATIAHLLNHTSGIPSWEDDPLWIKEGRGNKLDVKRIWKPREVLHYIQHTPLTNEPGEKFSYSNTNHTLLGLIIEKITGNDVIDEIRHRILNPVGISDVYLEGFQKVPQNRLAKRYHYATPEFKRDAGVNESFQQVNDALIDASASNLSVEWVAGGMVATAQDLAKYVAAFRAGKLLSPESMAFVQKWFPVDEKLKVGHGLFYRKTSDGHSLLGHTGSVLGYTGAINWFEAEDVAIVVLANVGTMHIGQKLPNAASVAIDSDFLKAALEYAREKRDREKI